MMFEKNNNKTTVGGGSQNLGKSPHHLMAQTNLILKSPEYIEPDYCLSCVYFKPVKGHFGSCNAALKNENNPNNKYFDGSKKGSSCVLWRTNLEKPNPMTKIPDFEMKQFRRNYNESRRTHYISVRFPHAKHRENERLVISNSKNLHRGLPYDLTSEIRKKNGYFLRRYNHHVIDFALKSIKNKIPDKEISKQIKSIFGVDVPRSTIQWWALSFLNIRLAKMTIKTYFKLKRESGEIKID